MPSYPLTVLLLSALAAGCAGHRKPALTEEEIQRLTYAPKPQRADQLVVCGETITCDDIMISLPDESGSGPTPRDKLIEYARLTPLEVFLAEARPQLHARLNNSITRVVLYKRAERELGANVGESLEKEAEKQLRRYILEQHGGNGAQADEALQRRGMSRASYKEQKKRQILAWHVVSSKYVQNRPITYGDLVAQYDAMKDELFVRKGVLQIRLIEIDAARVGLKGPNDNPIQAAGDLARELRKRIDAGEDFAELAKQYSHGHRGAEGGLWKPRDPAALAPPYDALAKQSQQMEPGQVAGPIEARGLFFIMKLEQKQEQGYVPLSEVQGQVAQAIMDGRRDKALAQLEAEIERQAAVADTSQFVDYCLRRLYRIANESKPAAGPQTPASGAP